MARLQSIIDFDGADLHGKASRYDQLRYCWCRTWLAGGIGIATDPANPGVLARCVGGLAGVHGTKEGAVMGVADVVHDVRQRRRK